MAAELATTLVATDEERLLQAEDAVRGFCGWHIAPPRTEDLTLDGPGTAFLALPTLRLTNVSKVVEDGTELPVESYAWSSAGYLLRGSGVWTSAPRGLVVSITHGYATPPPGVSRVVQSLAARPQGGGLASRTVGPFSETYATDLFGVEREALAPYRLPPRS